MCDASVRNAARVAIDFRIPALFLDAKVVADPRDLGHVAHQALGTVRVQVVRHNMPLRSAWVALNGAANVGQKVDSVRLGPTDGQMTPL